MIWLIGNKGMLGQEMAGLLKENSMDFIGTDTEVDITDFNSLRDYADNKEFSWIINCSAYTAVDKAEAEEEKAFAVNAAGTENIARTAADLKAKLVHFSTDYVFDGNSSSPYHEECPVNPISVYGKSKLEGERKLIDKCQYYYIIRISWLYGVYGPNFVYTMLNLFKEKDELNVVNDQFGAPTYTGKLAENIVNLVKSDSENFGTYHYADEGNISWFDFACGIKELALDFKLPIKDVKLNPVPTEQYPTPAVRPKNSAFDKSKIKKNLNFKIANWEKNLKKFFEKMIKEGL